MGYRRMNLAIRPVHRIKHIINFSATLAKNTNLIIPIADAVDAPVLANTAEVETGSKVNGFFAVVEAASNEAAVAGAIPNVYLSFYKNPGNNLTMPNGNITGIDDNKRWFFHQEMHMIENSGAGGNARSMFQGVLALPRGFRRMGPDDRIAMAVLCPQLDIALCAQVHYKEFR